MAAVILYMSLFMFALSGLMLAAAIGKVNRANYLLLESQRMAMRLLVKNVRVY